MGFALEQLPDLLLACRAARGMSQEDVAIAVGAASSSYRNWEKGRNRPNFRNFVALVHLFGWEDLRPESIGAPPGPPLPNVRLLRNSPAGDAVRPPQPIVTTLRNSPAGTDEVEYTAGPVRDGKRS